eukprot:359990-Chlamydomonas_euryale.AAC.8
MAHGRGPDGPLTAALIGGTSPAMLIRNVMLLSWMVPVCGSKSAGSPPGCSVVKLNTSTTGVSSSICNRERIRRDTGAELVMLMMAPAYARDVAQGKRRLRCLACTGCHDTWTLGQMLGKTANRDGQRQRARRRMRPAAPARVPRTYSSVCQWRLCSPEVNVSATPGGRMTRATVGWSPWLSLRRPPASRVVGLAMYSRSLPSPVPFDCGRRWGGCVRRGRAWVRGVAERGSRYGSYAVRTGPTDDRGRGRRNAPTCPTAAADSAAAAARNSSNLVDRAMAGVGAVGCGRGSCRLATAAGSSSPGAHHPQRLGGDAHLHVHTSGHSSRI